MPLGLFTNKFSPKLGAPRKTPSLSNLNLDVAQRNAEFGVENYGPIKLKLGSNEMVFEGGEWISGKTYFQPFTVIKSLVSLFNCHIDCVSKNVPLCHCPLSSPNIN